MTTLTVATLLASSMPARSQEAAAASTRADPLSTWNDKTSKRAIVAFVERVTDPRPTSYVPPTQRIATFDNDGTLWAEQPLYFQVQFALDRVRTLVPQHPEWKTTEPFSHLLAGDMKTFLAGGEKSIAAVIAATHVGLTIDEFDAVVRHWLATARGWIVASIKNDCKVVFPD